MIQYPTKKYPLYHLTLICIIFITFFSIQIFTFATDNSSKLVDLQSKVDSAMHQRLPSCTISYTGNTSTLTTDVASIIQNIYNNDDYMHYSTKSYSFRASGYVNNVNIFFTFTYWEDDAQTKFVDTSVTNILSNIITPNMNDFQKEKAIHDWIVLNVSYDTNKIQHSAYAALVAPYKTVCQGYVLLGYKMLTQAGIKTKIIEGTGNKDLHVWLLVQIDGSWYHMDPTWDDPTPDVKGRVIYDYYNLTDTQIAATGHVWTNSYPNAITSFSNILNDKISSDSTNSVIYNSLIKDTGLNYMLPEYTANSVNDLTYIANTAIKNGKNSFYIRYTNANTLSKDIKDALSQTDASISSYRYSFSQYQATPENTDVILTTQFEVISSNISESFLLDEATVNIGSTSSLKAALLPSEIGNKLITWGSSNPSVVTVSNGVVKGIKAGSATITATTIDGDIIKIATVNVVKPATAIKLRTTTSTLKIGGNPLTIEARVSPSTATDKKVNWSSSNSEIASVNSLGQVNPVSKGNVTITATSTDGKVKSTIKIKVIN